MEKNRTISVNDLMLWELEKEGCNGKGYWYILRLLKYIYIYFTKVEIDSIYKQFKPRCMVEFLAIYRT